jgi:hypothetical protein
MGIMSRVGFAIAALASVLIALAPLVGDVIEGPARSGGATRTAQFDGTLIVLAVAGAVVLAAAALIPRLWAQFAGMVVATLIAVAGGAQIATPRVSKDFAAEADLVLLGGGKTVVAAVTIALAGIIVALVGVRREPPVPLAAPPSDGPARVGPRAVVALVVAIAGILLGILPPLAITLGVIALVEIRNSEGRLRGQGIAMAAVAIGIVAFSLYISLTAYGMLGTHPPV